MDSIILISVNCLLRSYSKYFLTEKKSTAIRSLIHCLFFLLPPLILDVKLLQVSK